MRWSPADEKPKPPYPRIDKAATRMRWGFLLVIPVAVAAGMIGGSSIYAFWAAAGAAVLTVAYGVWAGNREYTEHARRHNAQLRRS